MKAKEIIRLLAGEFADVPDSELEKWIELARPWVSRKQFGSLYEQALAFMACHRMKMAGMGDQPLGEAGRIGTGFGLNSVSEGGSSISYGANQSSNLAEDAELGLTVYGLQFLTLRRSVIVPIHCSGEMLQTLQRRRRHRKDRPPEDEDIDPDMSVSPMPPPFPIAREDRLGGVMVKPGSGLKVDIDGSVRVDLDALPGPEEEEKP